MKRARTAPATVQRVVIDVGGTKLTTTTDTISRSSYLAGMIDLDAWASDASHCEEIFLDRDPEIFACVLRLMRQQPHIAGLVPHEPLLCASVIAEADYLGFEALLNHVKTQAYYNSREPSEDYPDFQRPAQVTGEAFAERKERERDAKRAHKLQCDEIEHFFEVKDEAHALRRFIEVYGDVGAALRSGALPSYYLERKPPKPEPTNKVLQVTPVQSMTWLLVGDIFDAKYGHVNDYGPMASMDAVVAQPALVRRVACQALVENERGRRWLEPMIHLAPADMQELLNNGTEPHLGLYYGVTIASDTTLTEVTGGLASRTILACDWLAARPSLKRYSSLWTFILAAESPPREFGFKEYRDDDE